MTAGKDIFLPRQTARRLRSAVKRHANLGHFNLLYKAVSSQYSARIIIDIPAPDCHNKYRNGDIAQLGERCLRKAEAEGSNPFISTMQTSRAALLACAFFIREQRGRNFGYIVNLFGIRYVRALSSPL